MSKLKQRLTRERSKHLATNSNDNLIKGAILATIIAATPLIFDFYKSVPDVRIWDTFLFTYESVYYESANVVAWTIMGKLIPLILLIIWFFTNRHWWYHVLIVPIAMYAYQIIDTLNEDIMFSDENHVLYLLPVMAIIIPSIYLIRARMFDKINNADKSMEELEEEFKIKPKSFLQRLGDYF